MSEKKQFSPSEKKKRDARKKGQVARSKEMGYALQLLALYGLCIGASFQFEHVLMLMKLSVSNINTHDHSLIFGLLAQGWRILFLISLLLGACFVSIVVLLELAQWQGIPALKFPNIDLGHINPLKGVMRILGQRDGGKLFLGLASEILEICIFALGLALVLYRTAIMTGPYILENLPAGAAEVIPGLSLILGGLFHKILILAVVLGGYRYVKSVKRLNDSLSMDFQELKQEIKQDSGDPHIKAERKNIHHEITINGIIENVRKATVVITDD